VSATAIPIDLLLWLAVAGAHAVAQFDLNGYSINDNGQGGGRSPLTMLMEI
jgi:hypothetical protein